MPPMSSMPLNRRADAPVRISERATYADRRLIDLRDTVDKPLLDESVTAKKNTGTAVQASFATHRVQRRKWRPPGSCAVAATGEGGMHFPSAPATDRERNRRERRGDAAAAAAARFSATHTAQHDTRQRVWESEGRREARNGYGLHVRLSPAQLSSAFLEGPGRLRRCVRACVVLWPWPLSGCAIFDSATLRQHHHAPASRGGAVGCLFRLDARRADFRLWVCCARWTVY